MPIPAERQTARSGSQPVEVIYLISAENGMYGKEPFSVYLRSSPDSDQFSDLRGHGLSGYTEKKCLPYTDADPPPKARDRMDSIV